MIALLSSLALAQEAPPASEPAPPPATEAPPPAPPAQPPAAAPAPPAAPAAVPAPVPAVNPWDRADSGFDPFGNDHRERPADIVEFSAEIGTLRADDARYEVFAPAPRISSWGFRAGVRPLSRLVVFADWQRARSGMEISADADTAGAASAGTSLGTNQVAIGVKGDLASFDGAFRPYVAAAALGVFGTARFDDDVYDPESPGQVSFSAFAPGVYGVGGAEVRIVPVDRLAVSWHVEVGYSGVMALSFDEFGDFDLGGVIMRTGLGIRL